MRCLPELKGWQPNTVLFNREGRHGGLSFRSRSWSVTRSYKAKRTNRLVLTVACSGLLEMQTRIRRDLPTREPDADVCSRALSPSHTYFGFEFTARCVVCPRQIFEFSMIQPESCTSARLHLPRRIKPSLAGETLTEVTSRASL